MATAAAVKWFRAFSSALFATTVNEYIFAKGKIQTGLYSSQEKTWRGFWLESHEFVDINRFTAISRLFVITIPKEQENKAVPTPIARPLGRDTEIPREGLRPNETLPAAAGRSG